MFEPSEKEIAAAAAEEATRAIIPPLRVRLDAARLPATIVSELKHVLENFPGEAEVVLEMATGTGVRRLKLGEPWRVRSCAGLRADLHELLGDEALVGPPAAAVA